MRFALLVSVCLALAPIGAVAAEPSKSLTLDWKDNYLTIRGEQVPGGEVEVLYLEAYCRAGSTSQPWEKTVIGHETRLVSRSDDGRELKLECRVHDGLVVTHTIRASDDEVDFQLVAHNPTSKRSEAHWAQPCMRVAKFTATEKGTYDYVPKSFVFVDGKLTRMPFEPWATKALYTPGQVWAPKNVDRDDVNPRPLSDVVLSSGLIGCFSADETMILAMAWEPYQELFQGVADCLHSDFRLGGLEAGKQLEIRGKIYLVPAEVDTLVKRYERDFPEHVTEQPTPQNEEPRP